LEVEPIRTAEDRKRVYDWMLANRSPREAECFIIGCNVALRAGDLLKIKFDQIEQGQKKIVINEQKTGKRREIIITPIILKSVARLRAYYSGFKPYKAKDFNPEYLFQSTSRRAFHLCQPICIQWLGLAFKDCQKDLGIDYNINTHSMRKTWGYNAYTNDADLNYIQAALNHKDQYMTLRYIGITKSSIQQLFFDNTLDIAS